MKGRPPNSLPLPIVGVQGLLLRGRQDGDEVLLSIVATEPELLCPKCRVPLDGYMAAICVYVCPICGYRSMYQIEMFGPELKVIE